MDIDFRVVRQIVIDHHGDIFDIQPSRSDIGCHHNTNGTIGELQQCLIALPLIEVALKIQSGKVLIL